MSDVKNIPFDQIQSWIKNEIEKGRSMQDIVAELAIRNDVTVLSLLDSSEVRHQQLVKNLLKTAS